MNEKNAKQESTTPVPTGSDQQGEVYPKLGPISTTRPGEDDDNTDHHCGADARQDADHRAQESGGDSVAHRSSEMEPSVTLTRIENHGQPEPEIIRLDFGRRHLSD